MTSNQLLEYFVFLCIICTVAIFLIVDHTQQQCVNAAKFDYLINEESVIFDKSRAKCYIKTDSGFKEIDF